MLALAVLLVLLGGWYARLAMELPVGWRRAQADPEGFDGVELRFPLYTVSAVTVEPELEVRISKVDRDIPVVGVARAIGDTELVEGDTISVRGRYRPTDQGGVVEAEQVAIHRWRRAKQLLSLVGLGGLLLWLPWGFRVREGRLWPRVAGSGGRPWLIW